MSNRVQTTSWNVQTSACGRVQGEVRWPHIRDAGDKGSLWREVGQENFISHDKKNFLPQLGIHNPLSPTIFYVKTLSGLPLSASITLSALPATYTQSTVEIFPNLLSLQNCSMLMNRVCASFILIPLLNLYVLIVTWAVSNYISTDDGSVLAIYRSVKFVYFNFFPQHDPNKLYVKHED